MGNDSDRKKCFIITPIGEDGQEIRRHIEGVIDAAIIPALKEKYDIIVAHRISEAGLINKQVIQNIYESDLVIANLTALNPNVMYELALAHTTAKKTISIAEKGTRLPFDIGNDRTIFYINDFKGVIDLKEALIKAEMDIQEIDKIDNPILCNLDSIKVEKDLMERLTPRGSGKELSPNDESSALQYIIERLNKIEAKVDKRNTERYQLKDYKFTNPVNDIYIKKDLWNSLDDMDKDTKAKIFNNFNESFMENIKIK